jgi:hypothetical protein
LSTINKGPAKPTLALDLPESQRAILATDLLRSLSPVLHDEDEGIAEAFLRNKITRFRLVPLSERI